MRQKRQSLLDMAPRSSHNVNDQAQGDRVPQHRAVRSKVSKKVQLNNAQTNAEFHQTPPSSGVRSQVSRSSDQVDGTLHRDQNSERQASKFASPHFWKTKNDAMQQPESTPPGVSNPSNHQQYDPDKPLLDLFIIARTVWAKKWLIVILGCLGAVLGVLTALSTPHKYYTDSRLILDPRGVQVTDTINNNNTASSQVLLAVVDSQMQVARSTPVLERVVEKLRLDEDGEFNGQDGSGLLSKIKDLFSDASSSRDPFQNSVDYLRKNMGVSRDPDTFLVYIGVATKNAEKSALVANTIVDEYLIEYSGQQSGIFAKTSTSIDIRLEELRLRLDEAEKSIVDYRAQNDIIDVGGGVINQKEMLALSNELAKVRSDQIAKSVLAEELKKTDINQIVSGSFPKAALSTTLSALREQYSTDKAKSDSLAVGLGPRHPKYIAAVASVDAVEAEIKNELRRIVQTAQNDVARAQNSEKQLASKLAVLKTRASDQSVENVGLRELERKADAIRQIYESLLRRARETTERGNLETSVIQVIAKAEPPKLPSTTSRKTTVIIFGLLGGILGLFIAAMFGAIESLKSNFSPRSMERSEDQYQDDQYLEPDKYRASDQPNASSDDNYNNNWHENRNDLDEMHARNQQFVSPHYQGQSSEMAYSLPEQSPKHQYAPSQQQPQQQEPQRQEHLPVQPTTMAPVTTPLIQPLPWQQTNPYPEQNHFTAMGHTNSQMQWASPAIPQYQQPIQESHSPIQMVQNEPVLVPKVQVQTSNLPDSFVENTPAPMTNVEPEQMDNSADVQRLKSDVQRLRSELETWANARSRHG